MKIDFTVVYTPTRAQEEFAKEVSRVLQIELPKEFTDDAYQAFIDQYRDAYDAAVEQQFARFKPDFDKIIENSIKAWLD